MDDRQPTDEPTEADPPTPSADVVAELKRHATTRLLAAQPGMSAQPWPRDMTAKLFEAVIEVADSHEELRALVGGRSAAPTRDEVGREWSPMVERFRSALMAAHADNWDMETVAEAAYICAEVVTGPTTRRAIYDAVADRLEWGDKPWAVAEYDAIADAVVALLSRSAAEPLEDRTVMAMVAGRSFACEACSANVFVEITEAGDVKPRYLCNGCGAEYEGTWPPSTGVAAETEGHGVRWVHPGCEECRQVARVLTGWRQNRTRRPPTMGEFWQAPLATEAVRFTGDTAVLARFVGAGRWTRADAVDMPYMDDGEEVVVWSEMFQVYLPCRVGWWVVRLVDGSFLPVSPRVFEVSYDRNVCQCGHREQSHRLGPCEFIKAGPDDEPTKCRCAAFDRATWSAGVAAEPNEEPGAERMREISDLIRRAYDVPPEIIGPDNEPSLLVKLYRLGYISPTNAKRIVSEMERALVAEGAGVASGPQATPDQVLTELETTPPLSEFAVGSMVHTWVDAPIGSTVRVVAVPTGDQDQT